MPKIRLTPEALQQKANEVTQCQEDQRKVIDDVASLINDIVADWEGEAQKGFIAAFESVRPTYEKFAPDLSAFASFLTNYSQTMEYLDVGGREDIIRGASSTGAN